MARPLPALSWLPTRTHVHTRALHAASRAGKLLGGMVSCTGSQFCGFALSETKSRAVELVEALDAQLELPRTIRIHFTGCPNSCGQAQVRARSRATAHVRTHTAAVHCP